MNTDNHHSHHSGHHDHNLHNQHNQLNGHTHHHTHHHNHLHGHSHGSNGLGMAFFLNFIFGIIELIGGYFTNSVAIMSDAFHDLGDSLSIAMSWYFERLSKHKRTSQFTYGYRRFSLVGALINAVVLLIGSIVILYEAVPRLFDPQVTSAKGMFLLAILGIAVNGVAVLRLKKSDGINHRMVMLHLLEDILGWVAVLVGSLFIYWFDLYILDPILSIMITLFVLYNVGKNLLIISKILLQGVPYNIDAEEVEKELLEIEGVEQIHDFHLWTLDSEYNVASLHVVCKSSVDTKALKEKIRTFLQSKKIEHATLEIENVGDPCLLTDC